ncbi:hypothetical protein [uncultured Gammaproteobacteria bacterium]|nr:hypothetical protein [uncultured Gammaproteobacteria bacterium]
MIRILTSVEITKDNPEYLRFKYNDNSYQEYLITNDAPEACTTHMGDLDNTCIGALDKGERKICKDDCVYYLIEDDMQISNRCNNHCHGNFKYCIFLINANFHGKFFPCATFCGAIFNNGVSFLDSKFDTPNNDKVSFDRAQFTKSAGFVNVEFNKKTSFKHAAFNKDVDFNGTKFSDEVSFVGTVFNDIVDFTSAIFNNVLNFSGVKNIDIDLKHAIIDRIEYGNVEFKSDNRETFLTLKNAALKQHDQIKALEFHTQEYQTHFKNLEWAKEDRGNKFILGFEYLVSNFGTNVWRSLVSLLVLTAVFYLVINRCNLDTESLVKFILPTSYDIDTVFSFGVEWWGRWLFLLYKILQFVMIYEVVKSFRKFSRTL